MFCSHLRHAALAMAAASVVTVAPAGAKDVTLSGISPTWTYLEAQGFAGRMWIRSLQFNWESGDPPTQLERVAADTSSIYVLEQPFPGLTGPQIIREYSYSGERIRSYSLDRPIDDIAVLNGTLYAISNRYEGAAGVEVLQAQPAGSGGTFQSIYAASTTDDLTYRLSTDPIGGNLVLASAGFAPSDTQRRAPIARDYRVLSPGTTWTAGPSIALPAVPLVDLSMRRDGSAMVATPASSSFPTQQTLISFPQGTDLGALPAAEILGPGRPAAPHSDEFEIDFGPGEAGIIELRYTGPNDWPRLIRTGTELLTANVQLANGVAPDGTHISNVQLVANQDTWSPLPVTVQPAASADFTVASLGTVTFTIDTAVVPRGFYDLDAPLVEADHQTATETVRRALKLLSGDIGFVGVDPFEGNYVGNGDWELRFLGWEREDGSSFTSPFPDGSNMVGRMDTSWPVLRQVLSLGTPDDPMRLSLDYRVPLPFTSVSLLAQLNGEIVAFWQDLPYSTDYAQLMVDITDPALRGLSSAELRFTLVGSGSAMLYIDNISLVAVPEPAVGVVMGPMLAGLLMRRRRR